MATKMLQVDALSFGPEAAALVAGRTGGRVLAVLRNAVYIESDGGHVVAIADGQAEDGPLAIRLHNLSALIHSLSPQPNATFQATRHAIEIDGVARIRWVGKPWVPYLPKSVGEPAAILSACDVLAQVIVAQETKHVGGTEQIAQRLTTHLTKFHHAVMEGYTPHAIEAITSLMGLGPGLTPSGDDIVAGLLASLVWQAQSGIISDKVVCSMVGAVREVAPSRTNRISARLLYHAGEGVLYAPAMEVGEALLVGDTSVLLEAARRLFSIGNTTGTDVATGLLAGIRLGTSLAQLQKRN
ncbi:MAG TPA: DUF2877 domain-containing protein [Chloroflexia bacterium]|jgi:hypothetical protein